MIEHKQKTVNPSGFRSFILWIARSKNAKIAPKKLHNTNEVKISEDVITFFIKTASIAVKIVEHEFSEIGNCVEKRNANLRMCSISEYSEDKDSENVFIKIGE